MSLFKSKNFSDTKRKKSKLKYILKISTNCNPKTNEALALKILNVTMKEDTEKRPPEITKSTE